MAVPLIGEILGDGVTLAVLPDGGSAADAGLAAATLQTLTPLFKKADVPGALVTGLSFATCVQLAHTFGSYWRPQPKLRAWLQDQVIARTAAHDSIDYAPPAGLTPYTWQVSGAALIAGVTRVLITDEPGTGKTATSVLGLVEWAARRHADGPVVVVCPASVIDSWVREWKTWAPHVRVVAWRGPKRTELAGTADVYVTSYDTARADATEMKVSSDLLRLEPAALVVDECFPAGTLVTTPSGQVAIETLQPGDEVIGVDHTTGEPVVTTVKGTRARTTSEPLTSVNGVAMTPNHPVWTGRGYLRADSVAVDDEVYRITLLNSPHGDLHADLRMVRADVLEAGQAEQTPEVLQPGVLGELADVTPGFRRVAQHTEASSSILRELASVARESRGAGDALSAPEWPWEPDPRSEGAGESPRDAARAGLPNADRRERADQRAAAALVGASGMAHGGRRADGTEVAMAACLQDRRGIDDVHGGGRAGRGEPQERQGTGRRRSEGRGPSVAGLDGAPVLEHGGDGGPRSSGVEDRVSGQVVYNIETGTGNYVAGDLLVHNCHFIKNPTAARTRAVLRIAKTVQRRDGAIVGLSGTPITRDTGDLHPMLTALDEHAWASKERFVKRYCMSIQGDYDEKILGLEPMREPEFRQAILGQHRRVAKADVLPDLPDKVYSIRTVELPAKWRKVYDDFKASMYAEMPDGTELSVFDEMSAYTHLSALSSAPGTVEVTYGPDLDKDTGLPKRHVHIELNEYDPKKADGGSWKVSALLEVLEERRGKQTIVFAPSRQLVEIAGRAAAKAGYRVGYVVGGQSASVRTADIDAFQARELDIICVTTKAGGVGLTLTAADAIVVLQRPWELDESIQLEDRAHRIGAEHESLQIIDIVAKGTIDGRRRESLPEKARHLAEFVQDDRVVDYLLGGKNVTEHATTTPRELISA